MILLIALVLALSGALVYWVKLRQAVHQAPQLVLQPEQRESNPKLSSKCPKVALIIPAYNEADNIQDCVTAALNSTSLRLGELEVWVVDDQSTDDTLAIVQSLQQTLNDLRLHVLAGQPKPTGQTWVGKNWACAQAAERTTSEYLLFIDADVRLKRRAIETAVEAAEAEQIDLLSLGPAIVCGCLAEWLVQPLIISTILVGFDFNAVNDPQTEDAFAAGPFMLFRRSSYERVGGHRAVAGQVVEDVELARRVKSTGLKLRYVLGSELAAVRMYRSSAALWEGWTKNLYLGSQRNLWSMIRFVTLMLLVCALPWAALMILMVKALFLPLTGQDWLSIALALIIVAMHYDLRQVSAQVSQIAPRYWWLTGLGGLVVAAIAVASVIKTETGWGWTWRGRALNSPVADP